MFPRRFAALLLRPVAPALICLVVAGCPAANNLNLAPLVPVAGAVVGSVIDDGKSKTTCYGDCSPLQTTTETSQSGAELYAYHCRTCHALDDEPRIAPSFAGLMGRTTKLQDGTTVVVDRAYFRESLRNPGKRVVAGHSNDMPVFGTGDLSEADATKLMDYLADPDAASSPRRADP